MLITAKEAKEMSKNTIRKNNDISKTQTIMKNIKKRAEQGLYYFDYIAHINYPIAKTLIEAGYKLFHKKQELTLEDFRTFSRYGCRIDWCDDVSIDIK